MRLPFLLHDLVALAAERDAAAPALTSSATTHSYGMLAAQIDAFAAALLGLGLGRAERVGVYLDKRVESVVAAFGAAAAGGVFVPLNPLLKAEQVLHILSDCAATVLVTSAGRFAALEAFLGALPSLRHVVLVDAAGEPQTASAKHVERHRWDLLLAGAPTAYAVHRVIDADVAALLYTSGSTGRPKGVVVSHRNLVTGACSVASYLENRPSDVLLAALPLSFDAGFSQLTTAFHVGARVVLLNYLMPRDVLLALERERVTGLTAVPPLYIQLATLDWPAAVDDHLRYFANTGGRMPAATLAAMRRRVPSARPVLMYGLTEAFRSTYLPPEEVDRRPDSIGKAIPGAEVLVLRDDGSECGPDEPGELVHRGPLVALGYWGDPERTAERFRPLPAGVAARCASLPTSELAVFSGDVVRRDAEGFLYFVGRRDEMIKTSGYRVSPTEVEEVLYATRRIGECAAFGIGHPELGQGIHVVATPPVGTQELDVAGLMAHCREQLPGYMVPQLIRSVPGPLPRNANGKIDRRRLAEHWAAESGQSA